MDDTIIIELAKSSKTMAEAARQANLPFKVFKKRALDLGVWNPNPGSKGVSKPKSIKVSSKSKYLLEDILAGKFPNYQSRKLKLRLIKESILKDECNRCGWSQKRPNEMFSTCELHHLNGNPKDHRLENLEILCPNCHSLTENFRNLKRD